MMNFVSGMMDIVLERRRYLIHGLLSDTIYIIRRKVPYVPFN